jgi:hypothetical protein
MEETSLNISIFDVGEEGEFPQAPFRQNSRNIEDVIADVEVLFQQEMVAPPVTTHHHYLLLDPTAQLHSIEQILGQPATIIHTDPTILSIQSKPAQTLPPSVHYHNTKTPIQMVPNTKLFTQNLCREAINHNTRTPSQWKSHLNEHEVTRVCALFMQTVATPPQYITQWVDSIQ